MKTIITALTVLALGGPAAAFDLASLGTDCRLDLGTVSHDVSKTTWQAAAAERGIKATNDADARAQLCDGKTPCERGDGIETSLFVEERGVVWKIDAMGYHGSEGSAVVAEARFIAPGVVFVQLDETDIDEDKQGSSERHTLGLLELASRRWLIIVRNADTLDNLDVIDGELEGRGCGAELKASLSALGAGTVRLPAAVAQAEAFVELGRKLTKEKEYMGADTAFESAIMADPQNARAHSGRGYAAMLDDSCASAEPLFRTALTLDSTPKFQAPVYFNLGLCAEKRKDIAAARAAFTKSIELGPTDAAKKKLAALPAP